MSEENLPTLPKPPTPEYIGDGVYMRMTPMGVELLTERVSGVHWLVLGDVELATFLRMLRRKGVLNDDFLESLKGYPTGRAS